MTVAPINLALLGAGFAGATHVRAFAGLPGARIGVVADPDPARGPALARGLGAGWVADPLDALADPSVAGVVIATPTDTHPALVAAAARHRKHVLVEKPAALTLPELARMQRTCDAAGVVLLVGQTLRFGELAGALRAAATNGDVGTPVFAHLVVNSARPWPGGWRGWQADEARSGGMALHLAIHTLDLALWLLGRAPVTVYAQGANVAAPGLAVHDYLHTVVTCEGGATALVESQSSLRGRGAVYQSARLLGTRGQAEWSIADSDLLLAEDGGRFLPLGHDAAQRVLSEHFVACCRGEAAPIVTAEQAMWTHAAAIAANRSLHTGAPVEVAGLLAEMEGDA